MAIIPKKPKKVKQGTREWFNKKKIKKTVKKELSTKTKNLVEKYSKSQMKQIVYSYMCSQCKKSFRAENLRLQIVEAARRKDTYISCPECSTALVADKLIKISTKQNSKVNRAADLISVYPNQGITPQYAPNTWIDRALLEKIAHELGKFAEKVGMFNPQLKFQRGIRGSIKEGSPENVKAAEYTIEAVDDYDLRFRVIAAAGITPAGKVVLPKYFMTLGGKEIPFTREAVAEFLAGKVFAPAEPKSVVPNLYYRDRDLTRFREIVASKKKTATSLQVDKTYSWDELKKLGFGFPALYPGVEIKKDEEESVIEKHYYDEELKGMVGTGEYYVVRDVGNDDYLIVRREIVASKKKKAAGTTTPGQEVEYQGKKYTVDSVVGDASVLTDEAGTQTAPVPNTDLNIQFEEGAIPAEITAPTLAKRIEKLVKQSLRDEKTLVPFTEPDPDYSVVKQTEVDPDFGTPYEKSDQGILPEEERAIQRMFRGGSNVKPVKTAAEVKEASLQKRAAKCEDCFQEMGDLETETCTKEYINLEGKDYLRYAFYYDEGERCHDCNIVNKSGNIHHFGCDMERCPICEGQLISCGHADKNTYVFSKVSKKTSIKKTAVRTDMVCIDSEGDKISFNELEEVYSDLDDRILQDAYDNQERLPLDSTKLQEILRSMRYSEFTDNDIQTLLQWIKEERPEWFMTQEEFEKEANRNTRKKTAEPTGYHETDDTGKVIELSRLRTLVQDYARAGQIPLDFDLTKVMSEVSRMTRKELLDILDKKQKGEHYPVVHAKRKKKAQDDEEDDLVAIINSRFGWAVAEQAQSLFEGYDPDVDTDKFNINALDLIFNFVLRRSDSASIDLREIIGAYFKKIGRETPPRISSKSTNAIVREIRKAALTEKDVEKDIKDEEEGKKHYKERAKEVEDEKAKKFFEEAAEDEAEHVEDLEEIVLPAVKEERSTQNYLEKYDSRKKKTAQEEEEEKPKTEFKELKTKPHGRPAPEEVAEAPAAAPELQKTFNEVKQHQQRLTEIKAIINEARRKTEEEIRKIQEEHGSVAEATEMQEGIEKLSSLIEQSESQIVDLGEFFVWLDTEAKTKKFRPSDKWRVQKLLDKFGKEAAAYLEKAEKGASSLNEAIQQRLLTVFPKLPKDKESSIQKKADVFDAITDLGKNLWSYVKSISNLLAEGEQLELAL